MRLPFRRTAPGRELRGDLHLVRLQALAERLESNGPIPAELVAARSVATRLTFRLDGEVDLVWWSFWSRPTGVTALRRLWWQDDVGWAATFAPVVGTDPAAEGIGRDERGEPVLRHYACRAEVHPLVTRTALLASI